MVNHTVLRARVSYQFKARINKYCERYNVNISNFFRNAIEKHLVDGKIADEYTKKFEMEMEQERARELTKFSCLIMNYFFKMIKMARKNFVMSGDFNMPMLRMQVNQCKKMFKLLDENIQKVLQDQMDDLELLMNKKHLEIYCNGSQEIQEFIHGQLPKRIEIK